MHFEYGEEVEVIPRGSIADDPSAEDDSVPTPPRTPHRVTVPVPVFPATASETPSSQEPYVTTTSPTAFFPYGYDIHEHDHVRVITGPLAGLYAVDGEPGHWKNPFTGWSPFTTVNLVAVRGG